MKLLYHRIDQENPNANIHVFKIWDKPKMERDLEQALGIAGAYSSDHYFLFDDGQATYWDDELWTWFKDTCQTGQQFRAILFSVYDKPRLANTSYTPPVIPSYAKVSFMRRTKTPGSDPIGLSLSKEEYEEVYTNHGKKLNCDDELRDQIYLLTAGHVASVKTMFHFIWTKVSKLAFNTVTVTPNIFVSDRDRPTVYTPMPSTLLILMPISMSSSKLCMTTTPSVCSQETETSLPMHQQ